MKNHKMKNNMIILRKIQLNNFLSHAKTEVEFKPEQNLLIDGKSGSGKSSIVEGLVWALYGKGRSSNNRSLIKRGSKKATVTVTLWDDGDEKKAYIIERSISDKNKLTLKVSEKDEGKTAVPIKTKGTREAQDYIEKKILHSSYVLFINSIVYPQENTENFVKQTAAKRKDIILEIIKAGDYDEYLKKAKDELSKIKTSKEVVLAKIEDRKNDIQNNKETADKLKEYEQEEERLKKEIDDLKTKFNEMMVRQKEVQDLLSDMKVQSVQMENKLKDYDKKSSRIDDLNKLIIELSGINAEGIIKEISELNEKKKQLADYNTAKDKVVLWSTNQAIILRERPIEHDYETEIANLNKELIDLMGEDLGACPKCGYIDPESEEKKKGRVEAKNQQLIAVTSKFSQYKDDLKAYTTKIEELGPQPELPLSNEAYAELVSALDKFDELNRKLIEAENAKKKIDEYATEIELLKAEQKDLSDEIEKIEKTVAKKDELESEERQLKEDITKLNGKLEELMVLHTSNNQLLGVAKHAATKIKQSEKELADLKKDLEVDVVSIEALEAVKEAFGPNGLRAIVIDYVIPQLEDKINNILSKLSDFRIKLETQKSGIGADVVLEGLFITIINDIGEEMDFDNYSGGERLKIIVAISEALAEIQKVGFRILDELFIGLDDESVESFVQVMTTLQDSFPQLFCITHLQSIKGMFDEKILVTKNNGTSNI